MMMGTQHVTIRHLRLVSFHGQRFYEITYSPLEEPERTLAGRAPFEEVYEGPQAGDRAILHFLMGAITQVEKGAEYA
jgi:hypothetical protein